MIHGGTGALSYPNCFFCRLTGRRGQPRLHVSDGKVKIPDHAGAKLLHPALPEYSDATLIDDKEYDSGPRLHSAIISGSVSCATLHEGMDGCCLSCICKPCLSGTGLRYWLSEKCKLGLGSSEFWSINAATDVRSLKSCVV